MVCGRGLSMGLGRSCGWGAKARFMAGPLLPPGVQPLPRTFSSLALRVRACSWSAGCATGVPGVTKQVCVEEDAGSPEVLLVQGLTSIHRQCHIMSSIYYPGGNGAAPAEPDPLITMGETESPSLLCLRPWPWMYLCQRSPRSSPVPLRGLRRIKVCLSVGRVAFSWVGSGRRKVRCNECPHIL